MTELPSPPVPADADLTDFKFMPLEVARLRRSKAWLICKRRPDLAFYMINLWTAAWHECPAGSLEDDDDVLADAAMCSPERWPEVREDVLRGWYKASDGRLYHPVVAEKVMDSWHRKAVARWRKQCDRVRKENHRRKEKGLPPLDLPLEPTRSSAPGGQDVHGTSAGLPEETPSPSDDRPEDRRTLSNGCPTEEATLSKGHPPDVQRMSGGIPSENALKGQGQGEERDREKKDSDSEAKASGPRSGPRGDPASKLFGPSVDWLRSVTGMPDRRARALIGRYRKDMDDDDALLALITDAQANNIQSPESWFPKAIEHRRALLDGHRMPKTAAEAITMRERDPAWAGVVR